MTTPTQAQIEAAAKIIYDDTFARLGGEWKYLHENAVIRVQCIATAKAALTAAAQVDERKVITDFLDETSQQIAAGKALEAATIERCAQVAENYYTHGKRDMVDAIRKLKDEP